MVVLDPAAIAASLPAAAATYKEFLRNRVMSLGVYVLAAGAVDPQKPHREDEVYYVLEGRATVQVGDESAEVGPGALVFVPAHAFHRFHTIVEDLRLLVFFAPAEGSV